jgi:hypothetical protein
VLNIKQISTIFSLIHCKIMEEAQEGNIIMNASPFIVNNTMIYKEDFMKLEFWFENDPSAIIYSGINKI